MDPAKRIANKPMVRWPGPYLVLPVEGCFENGVNVFENITIASISLLLFARACDRQHQITAHFDILSYVS